MLINNNSIKLYTQLWRILYKYMVYIIQPDWSHIFFDPHRSRTEQYKHKTNLKSTSDLFSRIILQRMDRFY